MDVTVWKCLRFIPKVIDAALGEIMTTCSKMEWLLKHGEAALKPTKRHTNLTLSHKVSRVYYEPMGVVSAIVSYVSGPSNRSTQTSNSGFL